MKKFVLLLFFVLVVSCDNPEKKDAIAGSEKLAKSSENYVQGRKVITGDDTCQIHYNNNSDNNISNETDTNLINRQKLLKATHENSHTISLRKAIDLFNSNQSINKYISKFAFDGSGNSNIGKLTSNDELYSFARLHQEGYLTGKFIMVNFAEHKNGTFDLDVMFQHKQDKIFRFVMEFDKQNNIFVIKQVYSPAKYDEQTVKFYRKLYSIYLNDEGFGV
ncbi:MAG: hypothetical protein N3A67_00445 [Ignavibacteria bacterium]|nr:hypothetical protein [Ignavibacteria bacterium]